MSSLTSDQPAKRKILVSHETARVPALVFQLVQWQYLERSIHRLLAAWGRRQDIWQDKGVLHRHIWDQAEIVRRLRGRIAEFPGGKPDAPAPHALQAVAETILTAPSFEDAIDAIYEVLLRALLRAYVDHVQRADPIHDAPTSALLHEINTIKEQHHLWYRDYRRRRPHAIDPVFARRLHECIAEAKNFLEPLPVDPGRPAEPCGLHSAFTLPRVSFREPGWAPAYDLLPYISSEFTRDVDARRLYWGVGYMREMNLPDDQLCWLYYGHDLPWDWHHDISRHLWDESRHGLSGRSRLDDWGIGIHEVGFTPYSGAHLLRLPPDAPLEERIIRPYRDESEIDWNEPRAPMTPADLYNEIFHIGMVAETGHFVVKNEAYDDFREGDDLASAEMMLFDIIDETAHVQYAHRWLDLLAERAGIDNSDYRQRAVALRKKKQAEADAAVAEAQGLPRRAGFAPWDCYQDLLRRIRKVAPLSPDIQFAERSPKPM